MKWENIKKIAQQSQHSQTKQKKGQKKSCKGKERKGQLSDTVYREGFHAEKTNKQIEKFELTVGWKMRVFPFHVLHVSKKRQKEGLEMGVLIPHSRPFFASPESRFSFPEKYIKKSNFYKANKCKMYVDPFD